MVLYLALIGLAVGFLLGALIARLAVPPSGGDDAPAAAPVIDALSANRAESGSLALTFDSSAAAWTRRLVVVCATAGLFAVIGLRFDEPGHAAIVAAYVSVLLVCAGTDAIAYRVPNVITYPAIAGAVAVAALMPDAVLLEALAGGGLAGGVLLLPSLLTGGRGMGMGDVKLVAFAGLALGFTHVSPALLFMALGGGAFAVILLTTGLRKKGEPIPYAPFISAGAIAALLWQGTAFVNAG
ncbi:MAG: prepilin peptidase [Chloroflexi bacterium]|nr:prepilin peptidase [Chloroflexota bacterium]